MRPLLKTRSRFAAVAIEKVERLLELLAAFRDDPLLGDAFVFHGGTALNVFSDDVPRLSVDIDLMYVREVDVAAMKVDRPRIDTRLRAVAGKLGYTVRGTNDEHSGQTYRLKYGREYLRIDVSYLSRVPLLAVAEESCPVCDPAVTFPVLDRREVLAGKVKAVMERTASRDVYDLARMGKSMPNETRPMK